MGKQLCQWGIEYWRAYFDCYNEQRSKDITVDLLEGGGETRWIVEALSLLILL
jgi:hypothetical protein